MRLLSKYNRINILTTIGVLLLSSVVYYFFIRNTLVHQLDKDLKIEESEFRETVKDTKTLPEPSNFKDEQEFFIPAPDSLPAKFTSLDIYNKEHHENIYYRQLSFSVALNGQFYRVTVRKSQEETDDLIKLILTITLAVVILLLISLSIINKIVFRSLWAPFVNTLQKIKDFDIAKNQPIILKESNIDEFSQLNEVVNKMTGKALQDYNEIRNFTENASHEIQTPLAIIKSRLELLSQLELKEEQMDSIQTIQDAVNRLSRLNQSLLLLTKIDNRQFHELQIIDLSAMIKRIFHNYDELLTGQNITASEDIQPNVLVEMNEMLADILLSNLITNSIKHNKPHGYINVKLNERILVISNSGKPLENAPEKLFERFMKEKANSDSLGLGLSIVRKIAETYKLTINYNYQNDSHVISVTFPIPTNLPQN